MTGQATATCAALLRGALAHAQRSTLARAQTGLSIAASREQDGWARRDTGTARQAAAGARAAADAARPAAAGITTPEGLT